MISSYINSIATALPHTALSQKDIADYMAWLNNLSETEGLKLKLLYDRSAILKRYSVISNFLDRSETAFFSPKLNPSLESRMELYNLYALPLARKAAERCITGYCFPHEITHLITVTCTGLTAPGLEIALLQELGLDNSIVRTGVNFIGCYAAFHALKLADAFCKSNQNANVLIVCVELCSIHFQPGTDKDILISNALFADGAAAVLVSNKTINNRVLQIQSFASLLNAKGKADMAWRLGSNGFLMTLSSYIPQLVSEGIGQITKQLFSMADMENKDIKHWAIHPGGRKILEVFANFMKLEEQDLEASYQILAQYGNMSAPTILFVLKYLMDNNIDWHQAEPVMALGFGPGLTLESMMLKSVAEK